MLRKATVLSLLFSFVLGSAAQGAPANMPEDSSLDVFRQAYEANQSNTKAAHDYAVALARSGQYAPALEILRPLSESPGASLAALFDYVTVTVWAGDFQTAVQLYETRVKEKGKDIPAYVKTNVAGAYYKLDKFQEAGQLYHEVAVTGDMKAKYWEAESLARLGKIQEAVQIYDELLLEEPDNTDIYVGRANANLLRGDGISAAKDIETAIGILAEKSQDNSGAKRLQIRADMAAQFIRNEEYEHAILLLKPSIADGSATVNMQCDYIWALFLNGDYKTAVNEGSRLWPDNRTIPIFGRRALADSYLRLNQPAKAIPIYQSILAEDSSKWLDKQSLAYAYVLRGDMKEGLALYKELLELGPEQASDITFDANALLVKGRYDAGQRLYQLVVDRYPDNKIFRQRFAADLNAAGLTRESHEQYVKLGALPDSQPAAAVGTVNTAVATGDYAAARRAAEYLKSLPRANPAVGQAISRFDRRLMGNVDLSYITTTDYKGNDVKTSQLIGEQRVADRFLVLAGLTHKKITDEDGSSSYNMLSVGGRYVDMKNTLQLWLDENRFHGGFTGYRFNATHFFGQHSNLDLAVSRTPLEDAQALNGRIMSTEYRLTFNRQIGLKDVFTISGAKAFFSDTNRTDAIEFNWNHSMIDNERRTFDWFVNYGRTDYRLQLINGDDPVYESPSVREEYGAGLRYRWNYPKFYWEGTVAFEWGRDRPDPMDFTPYARLEYGHTFSPLQNPLQALVLGVEYGWRTGHATNTGNSLQFNYRRYDVSYRFSW